jgi:hypothetical protein
MNTDTLKRYRMHRANGGTAQASLDCARIGVLLDAAIEADVASIAWEYEEERYEDVVGFENEREREQFYRDIESNTITGPFYCTLRIDGDVVASLGMVTLGPKEIDDYYAKLVEVELAMESEDELRQALGDALDACIAPLI